MKRSTKIFIVILVIFIVLCHIDMRPWFYERQKEYLNRVDETRKEYKIGSCYNMQDDLCYYIIFIDDNESNWNENDKSEFVEKKFLPSINYLSNQSSIYNVAIKQDYMTCDKTANYNGVIEVETVQNEIQYDIYTQVASSLGYKSAKEMNDSLKKELGVSQVAYLFAINKEGDVFFRIDENRHFSILISMLKEVENTASLILYVVVTALTVIEKYLPDSYIREPRIPIPKLVLILATGNDEGVF